MSRPIPPTEIARRLESAGFDLRASELAALGKFLDLLVRWNRVHNLTGIREPGALIDRHLVESLGLERHLTGERIADVGSGAGLPGVPLAIVEPTRAFTLIEARAKRAHFLRHVVGALGLPNATVVQGRAEDLTVDRPFDTVLARAVARPARLLDICRHLTGPGGILLILTARHLQDEFRAADFRLRQIDEPPCVAGAEVRPKSTIVVLERIHGEH
jgi:16S rRNA (guanine527-N7)-methyltransferase